MFPGFIYDDGGRAAAGYKGSAGDCVCRAVAIARGRPYSEVYAVLARGTGAERKTKRRQRRGATARNGIHTGRKWFKEYMASLGFAWTPTMRIGSGCKVHLSADELPSGRLVVAVSRHYTTMIDGVVRDTHDPRRGKSWIFELDHGQPLKAGQGRNINGVHTEVGGRCVYGYWSRPGAEGR